MICASAATSTIPWSAVTSSPWRGERARTSRATTASSDSSAGSTQPTRRRGCGRSCRGRRRRGRRAWARVRPAPRSRDRSASRARPPEVLRPAQDGGGEPRVAEPAVPDREARHSRLRRPLEDCRHPLPGRRIEPLVPAGELVDDPIVLGIERRVADEAVAPGQLARGQRARCAAAVVVGNPAPIGASSSRRLASVRACPRRTVERLQPESVGEQHDGVRHRRQAQASLGVPEPRRGNSGARRQG